MPTATFSVRVSTEKWVGNKSELAGAASKYLAYTDQTDTYGYHGAIESVSCNKKNKNRYGSVDIEFVAPVAQESDIQAFLDECDMLSRVERAKCISNPMDANL